MENLIWIENPAAVGLRHVGLAHEVAKSGYAYAHNAVDHTGWFLSEHQDETCSGVVYRLSGKGKACRYVVGVADPFNDDAALLDLSRVIPGERLDSGLDFDSGLRDAARAADEHAESFAENARESNRAWRAGVAWADALESEVETRRELLALLRQNRESGGSRDLPAIHTTITEAVCAKWNAIQNSRRERQTLKAGDHTTWYFLPQDHFGTFADAAGLPV